MGKLGCGCGAMTESGHRCGDIVETPIYTSRLGLYEMSVGGIPGCWHWFVELAGTPIATGEVRTRQAAERAATATVQRLIQPRA